MSENLKKAMRLARGTYQRRIVLGQARLSGADLRGHAREVQSRYDRSRRALVSRLEAAGVARVIWDEEGRRILEILPDQPGIGVGATR